TCFQRGVSAHGIGVGSSPRIRRTWDSSIPSFNFPRWPIVTRSRGGRQSEMEQKAAPSSPTSSKARADQCHQRREARRIAVVYRADDARARRLGQLITPTSWLKNSAPRTSLLRGSHWGAWGQGSGSTLGPLTTPRRTATSSLWRCFFGLAIAN